MKQVAEYLADAADPTAPAPPPGYLPQGQAERALERQAADAERVKATYAHLLLKAYLNAKAPQV